MTRTVLTAEQYSELVVALEAIRAFAVVRPDVPTTVPWQVALGYSPWCFVYLTQWFHRIGPIETRDALIYACAHMVVELCEERTNAPRL